MNGQKAAIAYVKKCIKDNLDGAYKIILHALGADRTDGIYLWGAGKYGLSLARYLRRKYVAVKAIIDNSSEKKESEEFTVIPFSEVKDGAKIFISVASQQANDEIVNQICQSGRLVRAIRFVDLCKEDDDI